MKEKLDKLDTNENKEVPPRKLSPETMVSIFRSLLVLNAFPWRDFHGAASFEEYVVGLL